MRYLGNKSKLLKQIIPYVPTEFNTYYEPFIGSGSLFLCIQPNKAVINDINKDVVNVWKHVKKNPDGLYELCRNLTLEMETYQTKQDKLKWAIEKTETLNNSKKYNLERAGLYLFLRQISWGGNLKITYENKYYFKGIDNYSNTIVFLSFYKKNILQQSHELLAKTKICCKDYKEIIKQAKENDFIYLDPPYFHKYDKNQIQYNKHKEVFDFQELKHQLDKLKKQKVKVMLSMSDFPEVRNLFSDYRIVNIQVYRNYQNQNSTELLIMNY
jgi:DNA adenine methylase